MAIFKCKLSKFLHETIGDVSENNCLSEVKEIKWEFLKCESSYKLFMNNSTSSYSQAEIFQETS